MKSMKKMNTIYRWPVFFVLLVFALQETNAGRFPSINDQFWRSWSVIASRSVPEIAFGVLIFFIAFGVLVAGNTPIRFAAIPILGYEFVRCIISFLSGGQGIGGAGLTTLCIVWLIRPPSFGTQSSLAAAQNLFHE